MTNKFLLIGITLPDKRENEADSIVRLLDDGFDFIHIRKPVFTEVEMRIFIESLPPETYPYIKIHSHFNLAIEYSLNGVHLNKTHPIPPQGVKVMSRSCHRIDEIAKSWPDVKGCLHSYQTLSPIYDSISKPGYKSAFDLNTISKYISGFDVVALGGVTFDKLNALQSVNFIGAAMMGAIWK